MTAEGRCIEVIWGTGMEGMGSECDHILFYACMGFLKMKYLPASTAN